MARRFLFWQVDKINDQPTDIAKSHLTSRHFSSLNIRLEAISLGLIDPLIYRSSHQWL